MKKGIMNPSPVAKGSCFGTLNEVPPILTQSRSNVTPRLSGPFF